ncbi:MAG TPA: L-2-amino-thiazoline-4-carboxylic acid hydrolase [candidate division Zixibacteria bacterium]|nr:L-2-amino-thiazoline-4-carboxylic acid hydrolase [candidate division Zixibacteria bacterium]
MKKENNFLTLSEASDEVKVAMNRVALLHLAYAETIIEKLGKEEGKHVIIEAIFNYGEKIGKRVLKGERDLPKIGVYSEEIIRNEWGDFIVHGCQLAKIFKEYDNLELGSLYCYVDPAKSMIMDKTKKVFHKTCEACGDDKCTLAIIDTTNKEQENFKKRIHLEDLDNYLLKK